MSASLVGSEMCIRDRFFVGTPERPESSDEPGECAEVPPTAVPPQSVAPEGPLAGDHPPRG
eukprot:4189193-Alexandrium_andersonii.AAC.1